MAEVREEVAKRAADVVSVTSGNERLRPLVLRAAEHGNADELRTLIQQGKQDKTLNDSLLRWALQKAAERGQKGTVDLLLLENVDWDSSGSGDKALSPLYRAVQRGHKDIVKTLLERGANLEAVDRHGRSVIHAAAWWNRADILRMLISHGANVNSRDHESKSVLHGLASDKSCRWGPEIIDILLATPIDLEYPDDLKRTALHWAAVSGKENLTRQLLLRKIYPRADVHATTDRGKTALHLAAQQGHAGVVDILLDAGADPMARSDGGWTALHNAAHKGHAEVIEVLVRRGCNVNVCTSAGMTALHWASQEGRAEAVSCLLRQSDVWRNPKDVDDRTPLVCAAESKHAEVVKILAPLVDVDKLSHDAIGACNSFMATIVDFGINGRKVSQPSRKSVYEVLYGRDPTDPDSYSVTTMVKNMSPKPSFRWIHLPANNMAWVETLITKAFIEDGAADVEGLKALQATFGQHHRGPTIYSRSMRPQCARIQRSDKATEEAPTIPKTAHEGEAASLTKVLSDAGSATPKANKTQENGTPKAQSKNLAVKVHRAGRTLRAILERKGGPSHHYLVAIWSSLLRTCTLRQNGRERKCNELSENLALKDDEGDHDRRQQQMKCLSELTYILLHNYTCAGLTISFSSTKSSLMMKIQHSSMVIARTPAENGRSSWLINCGCGYWVAT